jgi:hypothetical protein
MFSPFTSTLLALSRFAYPPELTLVAKLMIGAGIFCRMQSLGLRLQEDDAHRMADALQAVLESYAKLFLLCHLRGLELFRLKPKYHVLLHTLINIRHNFQNPWSYACWSQEDLIGRVMAVHRATNAPEQTLERWLAVESMSRA